MAKAEGKLVRAQKELHQLQERGAVVHADLRRSHRSLHEHVATLYLWWRDAREIEGYLDREYAALNLKSRTVSGINFRPLLVLVWGFNNTKSHQTALYSRTLNAIHDEYEARSELYAKDGVAKLANFIELGGGATKLAGYGEPDNDDADTDTEPARGLLIDPEAEQRARAMLLRDARIHANRTPMLTLPPVEGIEGELGLMLVKATPIGLQIVSYQDDAAVIDDILIASYRRRFEVQHPKVRPLFELLQTQCLPKHLVGLQSTLESRNVKKGVWAKGAVTSARRVLYRHDTGTFILSPIAEHSGIVSLVTPRNSDNGRSKHKVYKPMLAGCAQDVFMGAEERAALEMRCLRDFDFNLFDVGKAAQIPNYSESNSATHVLTLTSIGNRRDRLYIPFWPFYDTLPEPHGQVIPNSSYNFSSKWAAAMRPAMLTKLDREMVKPWLDSHAKHFKRDKHAVIQVTFGPDTLRFEFVFQNDAFENSLVFTHNGECGGRRSVVAKFASIDLMPALSSLALLPIDGAAQFALDSKVLRITFETIEGGPKHAIHVPTIDQDGSRNAEAFALYEPQLVHDQSDEGAAP